MLDQRIIRTSVVASILSLGCVAIGGEPTIEYAQLAAEQVAVPQHLLNLIHAREVQAELKFSDLQLATWEEMLREIDGPWLPARNLPVAQQREIVAKQELKMIDELERLLGASAVIRLRQIELQSQSARILVRPEIAKFLRLDTQQSKQLAELFAANDKLAANASADKAKADSEKVQSYLDAKKNEPAKALAILNSAQSDRLRQALGEPFDTAKLERIYPLAPELIDSGKWTNENRATLNSLRGQVILVHFYAFQCHNCVANFGHYKRWDETLKEKGVRVIGIQTPETAAEKDPTQVVKAAKKEGFQFPVLIDVENKNWDSWGNTMWPTVYVIDKKGYIRYWWQGELNWQGATGDQTIEKLVEQLLSEP